MILYHGSNVVVSSPKLIKTDKGKDFGVAFYLTSIKEQAERQAKRKTLQTKDGKPVVSVFDWDEKNGDLNTIEYKEANQEWLEMILKCRSDINYSHEYDIVSGKIADDSVGETVLFVLEGIMRKEDATERLKYQKINSQVAFCSERALKHLRFIKYYEVK